MSLFERVVGLFKARSRNENAPMIKPGRNEPCWCGSGKKYKKCHLPGEEQKAAERACSLNCGPT